MTGLQHTNTSLRGARTLPRLSRRASFWAIAFSFLTITALSTAPSALYELYSRRDHFSSLTITIVYAVYVVGVVASLLLVGHVSDWYGRRAVMVPALMLAIVAAVVFVTWESLTALVVARVLTGVALGAIVATATAYLSDLDIDATGIPTVRSGIVATIANVGGLALGPLIAGLLARYESHPLTVPYVVLTVALAVGVLAAAGSAEGHTAVRPRPAYHPQRLRAPTGERGPFVAALTGAFLSFAVFGLVAGLAGRFLAGPFHHGSPAVIGFTIFLTFGCGAVAQTTTTTWPAHRLLAAGIGPALLGLCLLVVSAWVTHPSLGLFLAGAAVAGAGCGAIFRGSLSIVIAASSVGQRAGALATYFTAGYVGISVPVVGAGAALRFLSPRVTLLIFAVVVGVGILAGSPILVRPRPSGSSY